MKLIRKKRRSLVRLMAACVPNFVWGFFLPATPRMYISAKVIEMLSSFKRNGAPQDDESFYSFKSHFQSKREHELYYSTPIKKEGQDSNRITELQNELNEIKKQIAKLMEHQCDQLQCSGYRTDNVQKNVDQPKSVVITAPPPPPPPMPSFNLVTVTNPLKIDGKAKKILPPIRNGFPMGKELLRDLKKVQLRKVDKSPGGGPIKKSKKINDPGDFLEAALRRRFGWIQNSPESSRESVSIDANDSFNSDTFNGKYEVEQNIKNKVT